MGVGRALLSVCILRIQCDDVSPPYSHTPLWYTVHPTDPGYRCVNPRVKLSPQTCPLQFFADFRSTTETPLVGCRSTELCHL